MNDCRVITNTPLIETPSFPNAAYHAASSLWITYVLMGAYKLPGYYLFDEDIRREFEQLIARSSLRSHLRFLIETCGANNAGLPMGLDRDVAPSWFRPGLTLPLEGRRRLIETAGILWDTVDLIGSPVTGNVWREWSEDVGASDEIGFARSVLDEMLFSVKLSDSQKTHSPSVNLPTEEWSQGRIFAWSKLRHVAAAFACRSARHRNALRGAAFDMQSEYLLTSLHSVERTLKAGGYEFPHLNDEVWHGVLASSGIDPGPLTRNDPIVASLVFSGHLDADGPAELIVRGLFPMPANLTPSCDGIEANSNPKCTSSLKHRKGKDANGKMILIAASNGDCLEWNSIKWADVVKCSEGTIRGTKMWKTTLPRLREEAKARRINPGGTSRI